MDIFFTSQNWANIILGILIWLLFTIVFFNFTNASLRYIFTILSIFYFVLIIINPLLSYATILFAGLLIIFWQKHLSKRKINYAKAIAMFERNEIRRGLTPPEICTVFWKPIHQILTLIIVSLLDKGFIVLHDKRKIVLGVSDPMQTRAHSLNISERAKLRRKGAQELKQILYPYEEPFIELFEQENGKGIEEIDFSITVKLFIQLVEESIEGFELEKTKEYYLGIVQNLSEGGETFFSSGNRDAQAIDWQLLRRYLDLNCSQQLIEPPNWFSDIRNTSRKNPSNEIFNEWILNLEEVINAGLSQEEFEIKMLGE